MDWYAWLCRAGLHPDAALEYALLFARNELGAADLRHLDHQFLATMGVAVAKHRLEILKLARKESSSSSHGKAAVAAAITALPWRATRLLAAAVHRSARSALSRLRASVSSSASSSRGLGRRGSGGDRAAHAHALLAAPRLALPARRRGGGRAAAAHGWSKIAASPSPARAGNKLPLPAMMLTNVSKPVLLTSSRADRWWSNGATVKALPAPAAAVAGCLPSTDACSCGEDDDEDEEMDDAGEEMRWEAMFQDLRPT